VQRLLALLQSLKGDALLQMPAAVGRQVSKERGEADVKAQGKPGTATADLSACARSFKCSPNR
jgi:hypothetical protein